jgi:hypothetical protein
MALDKPLKDFLSSFQKDLSKLQKTLQKESDALVKKVKSAAQKDNIQARRKEIEVLVEKNLKKFEPTINKFVHELNKTTKKAGVDLSELEKKVRDHVATARTKLTHASDTVKKNAKKSGAKAKKAATNATRKKAVGKKTPATVSAESAPEAYEAPEE